LRTLPPRLARILELDPRPLTQARPPEKKLVGNCRDFSCCWYPSCGIRACPRVPVAGLAYISSRDITKTTGGRVLDAEQQRWILVDAQLDSLQCEAMKIPFNRWMCRVTSLSWAAKPGSCAAVARLNPDDFGIFDIKGLGFVRGDFIRDVASLNKVELLPWDCWGIIEKPEMADPADLACLDALAGLTSGRRARLRIGPQPVSIRLPSAGGRAIHSYTAAGMETVQIPA